MKQLYLIFILLVSLSGFSQCPGLTINTQQQIDLFQQNNPGCTSISGNLTIEGSNIQNLFGLSQLTSVTGILKIQNTFLTDFMGLDNLVSVGGNLEIRYNHDIQSFIGLSSLQTINGNFRIIGNLILVNLNGLTSLTTIDGTLDIQSNTMLYDLDGLETLTVIGSGTRVLLNANLHSLNGLNNLTVSDGFLTIASNQDLTDISAISNIDGSQITNLAIYSNPLLAVCNFDPICVYLANPAGKIIIFNNASGCYNTYAITNSCGLPPICLPYGDYYINNQQDVDNFHTYYPECLNLNGNLYIKGDDITNLNGLLGINRVASDLWVESTELLTNLSGLDSLNYVGGQLEVGYYDIWGNNSLNSLTGLENLDTVNKALLIGNNAGLVNLDPLSSLKMVGDSIAIYLNPLLTNIDGISGINADSLTAINIHNNPLLSDCSIESVCKFLDIPESLTLIQNNAFGCQTRQEVDDKCITSYDLIEDNPFCTIYPNPVKDYLEVELELSNASFVLFDLPGKKLLEGQLTQGHNILKLSNLEKGIYILRLNSDNNYYSTKIIKVP